MTMIRRNSKGGNCMRKVLKLILFMLMMSMCATTPVNHNEAHMKNMFSMDAIEGSVELKNFDYYIKPESLYEKKIKDIIAVDTDLVSIKEFKVISGDKYMKVPEKMNPLFKVEIKGYDRNHSPLKVYAEPNEFTELSSTFKRPENFYAFDNTIYNDHYMKVSDNGYTLYVNIHDCEWNVTADGEFKIIGQEGHKEIINPVKNYTTAVCERTNFDYNDIHAITAGTELEGIEEAVIQCEETYGINSLFILSVAALESGWGNSHLAQSRNNLFGIAAYDSDVDAAYSFETKGHCVQYFAELIYEDYIGEGRYDLYSINDKYASSDAWAYKVGSLMDTMMAEVV